MDGTVNIRFVISKDVDFVADGYTKASKSIPQNINMLHTCKGRKKTRTICGCICGNMFLILPTFWSFMEQMEYDRIQDSLWNKILYD